MKLKANTEAAHGGVSKRGEGRIKVSFGGIAKRRSAGLLGLKKLVGPRYSWIYRGNHVDYCNFLIITPPVITDPDFYPIGYTSKLYLEHGGSFRLLLTTLPFLSHGFILFLQRDNPEVFLFEALRFRWELALLSRPKGTVQILMEDEIFWNWKHRQGASFKRGYWSWKLRR